MEILKSVLQTSLAGSILYFIICIFNPLIKKTFSATWNYYMLVITLLVFILPIGSFVKLPQVISYKDYMPVESTNKLLQLNKTPLLQENNKSEANQIPKDNENKSGAISNEQVNLEKSKTLFQIFNKEMLFYIWILGSVIFIVKEVYMYISFYKKLKNMSNIIYDESMFEVLARCKSRLNIKRNIIIKECAAIKSPMITGILCPVITVPKMKHNLDKLHIIFTHELIHYKRKDLWIKIIALIGNVINWFNPIIYIIRNKINMVCELSLDEQLIKNMDKSKRKYYGEIILEQLEYSQNRSLSLGAAVCKSRRELETRLKKIVFFKRTRKLIVSISIIAAMVFTSTSLFAANTAFAENNNMLKNNKTTEFAVFVSNDGLYMSELKDNNPILLDKSERIKLPVISRDGLYVAYTKEDSLYVCNIKTRETAEVAKNIESYDWNNSGKLIYSAKNAGMSMYNTKVKNSTTLMNNEYDYYNIKCDSKNKMYANKELEYTEGNNHYGKSIGIISYDLDSKEEKVILESKEGNEKEIGENAKFSELLESLGSTPNISKISSDDRYLYIWNKARAGSVSADMTEFAVYDLLNNKFVENNNMIALAYNDNISQNPIDSKLVAVNNGQGREMYYNKTLGIFNVATNTFTNLIPEDQVSMMPDYSEDGKNIAYSGTNNLKDKINNPENLKLWQNQPYNIYEVNIETKKVTQITKGNTFDFMPRHLLNNEMLFVRQEGDSYSLWKTKDGVETKLAESVYFNSTAYTNTWYYGHYKTEEVMDLFIG